MCFFVFNSLLNHYAIMTFSLRIFFISFFFPFFFFLALLISFILQHTSLKELSLQMEDNDQWRIVAKNIENCITLLVIWILMQVLWYLPLFLSNLGWWKLKSFIRTSVHFFIKVQTFLAVITKTKTKQNKYQERKKQTKANNKKIPTNLKRTKEELMAKKKWKKYILFSCWIFF